MNSKLNHPRNSFGLALLGCLAVAALSTALAAAAPRGANMKVSATVKSPNIIAVRIRHDMCPLCRELDPQFPKLIRQTNNDSVLFVTLDLTSETTQQQAALLAGALGLESVWTGDLSKLGSVTFLDGRTKRTISFVQTVNMKKIEAALRKAVDASNGKG